MRHVWLKGVNTMAGTKAQHTPFHTHRERSVLHMANPSTVVFSPTFKDPLDRIEANAPRGGFPLILVWVSACFALGLAIVINLASSVISAIVG